MSQDQVTDQELLRRYVASPSGDAFPELVRRHLGLVHASARRQLEGDVHGAEDVCQAVFTELAGQAGRLSKHPALIGWLYTTTRYLAQRQRRQLRRRQERERKAELMHGRDDRNTPDWAEVRPVLDDAMQDLRAKDRVAVLLRYFEGRDLRSVGAALGVSEDAARMRVDRALERLRCSLQARGITATASALIAGLPVQAVEMVRASFAAEIASSALATAGSAGFAGVLSQIPTQIIAMKTPLIATAMAAAVLVVPLAIQQHRLTAEEADLARLHVEAAALPALRAEHDRLGEAAQGSRELEELRDLQPELARLRAEAAALRKASREQAPDPAIAAAARDLRAAERARSESAEKADFRREQKQVIDTMKHLGLAARIFASDHQDQFPTTFQEVAANLPATISGLEAFEFYPQPRVVTEAEPGLFLFREKQPRRRPDGSWERAYALADGSVQTLSSATDDFSQVELDRGGVAAPVATDAR